jgi:hypothetical protein
MEFFRGHKTWKAKRISQRIEATGRMKELDFNRVKVLGALEELLDLFDKGLINYDRVGVLDERRKKLFEDHTQICEEFPVVEKQLEQNSGSDSLVAYFISKYFRKP